MVDGVAAGQGDQGDQEDQGFEIEKGVFGIQLSVASGGTSRMAVMGSERWFVSRVRCDES